MNDGDETIIRAEAIIDMSDSKPEIENQNIQRQLTIFEEKKFKLKAFRIKTRNNSDRRMKRTPIKIQISL